MTSLALPLPNPPAPQPLAAAPTITSKSNTAAPSASAGAGASANASGSATGNATPQPQPKRRGSVPNPQGNPQGKERSATPDEEDEDEDEDGDEPRKKKKKGKSGLASEYKYQSEIAAMMFVFGEVQEPLPDTIKLVEDVVRGQIIEIVTRARLLTHLRSSRSLSAEDLIFLIREDRGKVNRLRTYLSWKDVRKKAKEDDAGPGADVDVDLDEGDKSTLKGRKTMVKLPWELMTPFSDFLRGLPTSMNKDEEDEEDDDEMQAHQDSMQRLREADEITKKMTKDEYVHYSDCRQASFTYRKARRFREFINFAAYLDVRPNDDIIDILGFLAFEMVRSLCVTALDVRARHEQPLHRVSSSSNTVNNTNANASSKTSGPGSPVKRKSTLTSTSVVDNSPNKRRQIDHPSSASPETADTALPTTTATTATPRRNQSGPRVSVPLFAAPPSARQPLTQAHVLEAYAQIQRQQAASRVGGMRNFRGSITKGRMALV